MHQVKKLFFVPVGLPGMGKSTLAKNIRFSIEKNLAADIEPRTSNLKSIQTESNQTQANDF